MLNYEAGIDVFDLERAASTGKFEKNPPEKRMPLVLRVETRPGFTMQLQFRPRWGVIYLTPGNSGDHDVQIPLDYLRKTAALLEAHTSHLRKPTIASVGFHERLWVKPQSTADGVGGTKLLPPNELGEQFYQSCDPDRLIMFLGCDSQMDWSFDTRAFRWVVVNLGAKIPDLRGYLRPIYTQSMSLLQDLFGCLDCTLPRPEGWRPLAQDLQTPTLEFRRHHLLLVPSQTPGQMTVLWSPVDILVDWKDPLYAPALESAFPRRKAKYLISCLQNAGSGCAACKEPLTGICSAVSIPGKIVPLCRFCGGNFLAAQKGRRKLRGASVMKELLNGELVHWQSSAGRPDGDPPQIVYVRTAPMWSVIGVPAARITNPAVLRFRKHRREVMFSHPMLREIGHQAGVTVVEVPQAVHVFERCGA